MGKIEASRHNLRMGLGTRKRQGIVSSWVDGIKAVISHLTSAIVRALLVLILVAMPSMLLPGVDSDSAQVVSLIGIFGAVLVFFEYSSTYPSIIEFRDAPPFNRVRYISLFLTVSLLTIIFRGQIEPTTLTRFVGATGSVIGQAIDYPFSPVRLVVVMLPEDASTKSLILIQATAGLSYLISLMTLAVFLMVMRIQGWPSRDKTFNVWVNLPTFDPSAGGDVVARLYRDGRLNIILGFVLPFLSPLAIKAASQVFNPIILDSPQTMVWTMAAWSFLPTSLFMRGIAMGRVASMIQEKRKRNTAFVEKHGYVPA